MMTVIARFVESEVYWAHGQRAMSRTDDVYLDRVGEKVDEDLRKARRIGDDPVRLEGRDGRLLFERKLDLLLRTFPGAPSASRRSREIVDEHLKHPQHLVHLRREVKRLQQNAQQPHRELRHAEDIVGDCPVSAQADERTDSLLD